MIGLYIHIPFCNKICTYCDFAKKIPKDDEQISLYIETLIKELDGYKKYFNKINTIYIGGGTPNFIKNEYIKKLLKYIKENIDFKNLLEYTIECNIEFINKENIKLYKEYGINRISIGVQTFGKKTLINMNRIATKKMFINAYKIIKNNKIDNISIDLMFSYYKQKLSEIKNNLRFIKKFDIKHISYYSLILEEKTLLYLKTKNYDYSDDLYLKMYKYINKYMKKNGFIRYEFSNYAKKNFYSKHNLKYWSQEEYIGIGLNATSFINNIRYKNSFFINQYIKNNTKEYEILSSCDLEKEYIIMGLRKINGISFIEFKKKFNKELKSIFNYDKYIEYFIITDTSLRFNDKGILISNKILGDIL